MRHRPRPTPSATAALAGLWLAWAACGADGVARSDAAVAPADAAADAPASDVGVDAPVADRPDAAPVCAFVGGSVPAAGASTTFACALAPEAARWGDCLARFPGTSDEIALLCDRPFPAGPHPAQAAGRPDGVLAGTCGGQQVVVLNVSPGHGIECHYDGAGALVGLAFFDDSPSYCDNASAAIAAGMVTRAPCLFDMEAGWEGVSCDSAPALSPSCADAGAR